jgi:hypothetical protein
MCHLIEPPPIGYQPTPGSGLPVSSVKEPQRSPEPTEKRSSVRYFLGELRVLCGRHVFQARMALRASGSPL